MNKLEGLYELQRLNIPSVEWNIFKENTKLDKTHLWTIRTAVYKGRDVNLPKLFGATAQVAQEYGQHMRNVVGDNGIVIYYPYLVAEKSGNLQIGMDSVILEVVNGDLEPLLQGEAIDTTYIFSAQEKKIIGNQWLLSEDEIAQILMHADYLKQTYRYLIDNKNSLQLEFSFASESDLCKRAIGNPRLIFFEIRTV